MAFELMVPTSSGGPLTLSFNVGEILFVLGANGTGKSTLMHSFYMSHRAHARRISAHRQNWFSSNALDLSPAERRNYDQSIHTIDMNPNARWREEYAHQRNSIAIFDLISAENRRAREVAGAVDADNVVLAKSLAQKDAPLKIINELLRFSNIPIEILVKEDEEVFARKNASKPYSIAELSDGERNALIIAASVLTAVPNTLLLVDEPERHLHRSIISPLLTQLFSRRADCVFVISTHDVMLPLDNTASKTLLIRGCTFNGSTVQAWEADLVPPQTEVDDELKRDILGARRRMLFVEGSVASLDQPLYSLLFPEVSVVPKASCRNVEHAVFGIRASASLHWLDAWGIVDNDGRSEEDVSKLKERGVHALPFVSVEAIYYHPEVIERVAKRHADVTGENAKELFEVAKSAALGSLSELQQQRLSARVAEQRVRQDMFSALPTSDNIAAGSPITLAIDVAEIVAAEKAKVQAFIFSGDLLAVVSRYAVRETPVLDQVAKKLGFQNRAKYEAAVRKLLLDDKEVLAFVRSLFGTLVCEMRIT